MSDQSTRQYVISYAIKRMRGGIMLTEQMIINAKDLDQAHFMAGYNLKRGEIVHSIEALQ